MRRLLAVLGLVLASGAAAQLFQAAPAPVRSGRPSDVVLQSSLTSAEESMAAEDWPTAVRRLQEVIDAPSDAFAGGPGASLKTRAAAALDALPPAGRAEYAGRFEASAAIDLRTAVEAGDLPGLRRLAETRRWAPSGVAAGRLAVRLLADAGERAAADRLAAKLSRTGVEIETARPRRSPARRQAIEWRGPGGDATAAAVGGPRPVVGDGAWQVDLLETLPSGRVDPRSLDAAWRDVGRPAAEPLLNGGLAVVAGPAHAHAFDAESGELAWRSAVVDPVFAAVASAGGGAVDDFAAARMFRDAGQAQLSADDGAVYAVFGGGALPVPPGGDPTEASRRGSSRLAAYETRTGRLKWVVGGPAVGAAPADASGATFLGPPVRVGGGLYVLVQQLAQVRLWSLDPRTGRTVFEQDLWNRGGTPAPLADRAARPVDAGGLLVCPVGGAYVAVDPLARTLEYAGELPGYRAVTPSNDLRAFRLRASERPADVRDGWLGPLLRSAGGRVVLTDADRLTVFDAAGGASLWSRRRGRLRWVDSIDGERIVAAGPEGISAFDAADGSPLWTAAVAAVGTGVRDGRLLTLPTAAGLATVDVTDGQIVAETASRSGRPLGNLAAAGGRAVAFDGRWVTGFADLASLDGPDSVLLRAADALHRDDAAAADRLLANASTAEAPASVREIAAATLTRRLSDTTDEAVIRRAEALPLDGVNESTAAGLASALLAAAESAGDRKAVVRAAVRVLSVAGRDLVRVDDRRLVRPSRLAAAKLRTSGAVDAGGAPDSFEKLVREAASTLSEVVPASLLSAEAAASAAEAATPDLRREISTLRLLERRGLSGERRSAALRWLAKTYADAGLDRDVRAVVENAQADADWAAELRERLSRRLDRVEPWPSGEVTAVRHPVGGIGERRGDVPVRRGLGASQTHRLWSADFAGRDLSIRGPDMRVVDSWPTRRSATFGTPPAASVEVVGHAALVVLPDAVVVRDLLTDSPRTLAEVPLVEADGAAGRVVARPEAAGLRQTLFTTGRRRVGTVGPLTEAGVAYTRGESLFCVDPLEPDAVFWRVDGVFEAGEVFGDERAVLVRERAGRRVARFAPLDGRSLGETTLPDDLWNGGANAAVGAGVLRLSSEGGGVTLRLTDLFADEDAWSRSFATGSLVRRPTVDTLAICEPGGTCVFLDAFGGSERAAVELEAEGRIASFAAWIEDETAFAVASDSPAAATPAGQSYRPLKTPGPSTPADGPAAAVDLSTGETLWSRRLSRLYVPAGQPPDWPLVIAAAVRRDFDAGESRRFPKTTTSVHLIDKATGETRWSDDDLPAETAMTWVPRLGRRSGFAIRFDGYRLDVSVEPTSEDAAD